MKYLIDINICVHLLRNKFNVVDKFIEIGLENCLISEITHAELIYGAELGSSSKGTVSVNNFVVSVNSVLPTFKCITYFW